MAFQQEYFAIPPITRAYTTTCLLTTFAVVSRSNFRFFCFFDIKFSYHYSALLIAQPARQFLFLYLNYQVQLFRYNRC